MDVALIRWPDERARRSELATRKMPRLLLCQPESEPPVCLDPLEDWVRVPAPPEDVRARAETLASRFHGRRMPRDITIEIGGLIHFGGGNSRLTPLQARLVEALVERTGTVVSRDELIQAGWGMDSRGVSQNTLEANMARLRRRIESLGLHIRTIRSRGYLLERAEAPGG